MTQNNNEQNDLILKPHFNGVCNYCVNKLSDDTCKIIEAPVSEIEVCLSHEPKE